MKLICNYHEKYQYECGYSQCDTLDVNLSFLMLAWKCQRNAHEYIRTYSYRIHYFFSSTSEGRNEVSGYISMNHYVSDWIHSKQGIKGCVQRLFMMILFHFVAFSSILKNLFWTHETCENILLERRFSDLPSLKQIIYDWEGYKEKQISDIWTILIIP